MGRFAGAIRLCALKALSTVRSGCRSVVCMGETWEACVGRGDGTDCPNGEDEVLIDGIRCEECLHYWELDATDPERRLVTDDGLTRPHGEPREAGPGTAA